MNLTASITWILIAGIFGFVFVIGIENKTKKVNNSPKLPQRVVKNLFMPISFHKKTMPCFWLKHLKRQFKLCKKDPGLSDILLSARDLAINSCDEQFRYNRWNCTKSNRTFKNIYRETAFLYAMASSAITFTIARACAEGKLKNCFCEKDQDYNNNINAWKWGLCSDNVKYARKFTKQFLQLKNKGDDQHKIYRHNSLVGIETVIQHFNKKCRCPGISGSCNIKICWKQVEPFKKISMVLKQKYQHALLTKIGNTAVNRSVGKNSNLLYLLSSSTFCKLTPGRRCLNRENCSNLCCGRGFNIVSVQRTKMCRCRCGGPNCINPQCDVCHVEEDQFFCK